MTISPVEAPHLILNPHRSVEFCNPAQRFEGWVELELIHARTGLVARRTRFRNLITDAGLNAAGTIQTSALWAHCAVGTGSSVPQASQLGLDAEIGRTNLGGGIGGSGLAPDNSSWVIHHGRVSSRIAVLGRT